MRSLAAVAILFTAFLVSAQEPAKDIGPIKAKGVGFKVGDVGTLSDVDYRIVDASFGNSIIVTSDRTPGFRFFATLGQNAVQGLANGSVGRIRGEFKIVATINYRGDVLFNAEAIKGGKFVID